MLIRLSARIEEAAKGDESSSSEDEIFYPASEDGKLPSDLSDILTRKSISDEDALNRRKQIAEVFRKRAAIEVPSEVQAVLDRQATLFRDLGLDDQEPQSKIQTKDRPLASNNPYALLQDLNVDDDAEVQSADVNTPSKPVVHTMMPAGDSPFWVRYGNRLRVNGTKEEVCIIE